MGHLGREEGPGCHSKTTALYIQEQHGGSRSNLKKAVDGSVPSAARQDFTLGVKLSKEWLLCSYQSNLQCSEKNHFRLSATVKRHAPTPHEIGFNKAGPKKNGGNISAKL